MKKTLYVLPPFRCNRSNAGFWGRGDVLKVPSCPFVHVPCKIMLERIGKSQGGDGKELSPVTPAQAPEHGKCSKPLGTVEPWDKTQRRVEVES